MMTRERLIEEIQAEIARSRRSGAAWETRADRLRWYAGEFERIIGASEQDVIEEERFYMARDARVRLLARLLARLLTEVENDG